LMKRRKYHAYFQESRKLGPGNFPASCSYLRTS
jgi:hypothetical protein